MNGGAVTLVSVLVVVIGVVTRVVATPPGLVDESLCLRQHCQCIQTNVTCHFGGEQVVLGEHAVPANTTQLQLLGSGHLQLRSRSIGGGRNLKFVLASGWKHLILESWAISGNMADDAVLEIVNGDQVVLETSSLHMTGGLTVILSNLLRVHVRRRTFQRLNALRVDNAHELKLESNALKVEQASEESLQNKVIINNTTLPDIPGDTFPSAIGDVFFTWCTIGSIESNAFSALRYDRLVFHNSTVKRIAGGALSERTLVKYFAITSGCTVELIHSGAIQGAVTHMDIYRSRLVDLAGSAINATTIARFEIKNSVIGYLRAGAVQLRDWTNLFLDNNSFARMDAAAIRAPVTTDAMFRCVGNTFGEVQKRTMLIRLSGGAIESQVENNRFRLTCQCGLKDFLNDFLGGEVSVDANQFYNTSTCTVDAVLARCGALPQEDAIAMSVFDSSLCSDGGAFLSQCIASVVPEYVPEPTESARDDQDDAQVRERMLMILVFGAGLVGAASVAAASCVTWIARRDPCGSLGSRLRQFRQHLIPSPSPGIVPAPSISRLPVDEYERRHTDTAITTLSDVELDDDGVWAPSEDKSTQTMPEELTQELLQTLRAKLDDPNDYSEACVIIEHLYDLIKVEETNATAGGSMDNLYDVITPRRRPGAPIVATASVGTRAPSPGALRPIPVRPAPAVCEYAEPSDARIHLYSELPGRDEPPAAAPPPSERGRHYGFVNPATRPLPNRPRL